MTRKVLVANRQLAVLIAAILSMSFGCAVGAPLTVSGDNNSASQSQLAAAQAAAQPTETAQECADGKVRNGGGCCWPGQMWSGTRGRCMGTPSSCPSDRMVSARSCEARYPSVGLAGEGTTAVTSLARGPRRQRTEDSVDEPSEVSPSRTQRGAALLGATLRDTELFFSFLYGVEFDSMAVDTIFSLYPFLDGAKAFQLDANLQFKTEIGPEVALFYGAGLGAHQLRPDFGSRDTTLVLNPIVVGATYEIDSSFQGMSQFRLSILPSYDSARMLSLMTGIAF